ncbi:hypothetical protein ACSBR2_011988 [Camellia fascicularis]
MAIQKTRSKQKPDVWYYVAEQKYCKFNSQTLTMFTSSLYLAALFASFLASTMTKKLGRKFSMLMGGCVFCCGALLNAFAIHLAMLIIGRILLGVGGDLGWRISLGGAAVPAVLMIFSSLWVSETPNSLIERGHLDKAKKQLQRIRGVADVQAEFNDLVDASAASKEVEHPWRNLSMRKYRPQLCLAILIPMFQQLTGINVVMFYAPVLFKTIGFQSNASLASAMITGGVNVLATFISVFGTDRWGRKPLFLWGAFAFSWGPLGWLVPSEIFPLEIRSSAQSIVVAVNMSFTFLVAQLFLAALCMVKYGLFIIFAGLVLIMSLFIIFFVPETNNIPIEEMSQTASEEEDDACSSFLDGIGSEENGGNDLDDGLMVRDTDMDMARVRVRIRDQLLNLDNIACYEKCSMMNF